MQGERVEEGELGPAGLPFDRRWGVVDEETGKVLSAKREGRLLQAASRLGADETPEVRLPDGDWTPASDTVLDKALSEWLGLGSPASGSTGGRGELPDERGCNR
jgi:uncharacterized protein YcbX